MSGEAVFSIGVCCFVGGFVMSVAFFLFMNRDATRR